MQLQGTRNTYHCSRCARSIPRIKEHAPLEKNELDEWPKKSTDAPSEHLHRWDRSAKVGDVLSHSKMQLPSDMVWRYCGK